MDDGTRFSLEVAVCLDRAAVQRLTREVAILQSPFDDTRRPASPRCLRQKPKVVVWCASREKPVRVVVWETLSRVWTLSLSFYRSLAGVRGVEMLVAQSVTPREACCVQRQNLVFGF